MREENETMGNWKTMGGKTEAREERETWTLSDATTMGGDGKVVLAGRYRVVKRLGEGGMGSVWLAEDTKLDGRRVAVKMLPSVLAGKKGAYRQVKAEAVVAMKLSHPNIATVRAFEEDEGGVPFLVMDYIEGEGLDDILAEKGALGEEETVRLLGPVAAALDYAHSQGVVHRDVKPGNVMVRKDGTPFVLDFGIAREVQETMTRVTGKLSSGTLLYMSPEQLNGDAPKAAQDVYSFASMVYECLSGHAPFFRGAIEDQIKHKTPEALPEGVGEVLREGVMAGLAKDPEGRPGNCAGVLEQGWGCQTTGVKENTVKNSENRFADSEEAGGERKEEIEAGRRTVAADKESSSQSTGKGRSGWWMAVLLLASLAWWGKHDFLGEGPSTRLERENGGRIETPDDDSNKDSSADGENNNETMIPVEEPDLSDKGQMDFSVDGEDLEQSVPPNDALLDATEVQGSFPVPLPQEEQEREAGESSPMVAETEAALISPEEAQTTSVEQVWQEAQDCARRGDWTGAVACYKQLEDMVAELSMKREMQVHQAESWFKAAENSDRNEREKALKTAESLCKRILWGGVDIPFVKSVVLLARIQQLRGDSAGASKTLQDYMATIKQVDEVIKENGLPMSESPMSGARSLLGRLLKSEAEQLEQAGDKAGALGKYAEALGEYYNVFVKYGQGPDGPAAGMESKAIKEILETRFGKTVQIELPAEMAAQAAGTEFMMADQLFRKKDWAEAEKEYRRVLKQFPESGDLSAKAVANLLQCYVHLGDTKAAKETATRLGGMTASLAGVASKGVLAAGALYQQGGDTAMRDWMFEQYLEWWPGDEQAGSILFFLSGLAEKEGNMQRADRYLAKIIAEHPNDSKYHSLALSKVAWKAYANRDYEGAVAGLTAYLRETQNQPSSLRAQALFALGDCLRRTNRGEMAVKQFDILATALSEDAARWGSSEADRKRNKVLLEQTLFWRAFTLVQQDSESSRRRGISQFDEYLKKYPQSAMASKALKAMGAAQMALKDPASNDTYARLAKEYPDTDEGKNAQYTRISGALELKQYEQAREAARAMLQNVGSFKTTEFLHVGNELLEYGLYPEATAAFEQVRKSTDERGQLEQALFGLGKAKHGAGDERGAVEAMDELMTRWPKSALFYDAEFVLAAAHLKLGETAAANDALNKILRYADKPEVNNEASMLMAQVQKKEGDLAGAAKTYQRLEYLNLLNMPTEKERAQMKKALLEAMALEEEMKDDARLQETADAFLEHFPLAAEVGEVRRKRQSAAMRLSRGSEHVHQQE